MDSKEYMVIIDLGYIYKIYQGEFLQGGLYAGITSNIVIPIILQFKNTTVGESAS